MLTPCLMVLGAMALIVYKLFGKPYHKQWLQIGLASLVWSWLVLSLYPITSEFQLLPKEASPLVSLKLKNEPLLTPRLIAKSAKALSAIDYNSVASIPASRNHQPK